jgi:hypothetical protein
MIAAVFLRLLYLIFCQVIGLARLMGPHGPQQPTTLTALVPANAGPEPI